MSYKSNYIFFGLKNHLLTVETFNGFAKGLDPRILWGEVLAKPLDVSASSKVSSTVAMSSSSPKLLPSDLTLPFMLESVKEDLAIILSRKGKITVILI